MAGLVTSIHLNPVVKFIHIKRMITTLIEEWSLIGRTMSDLPEKISRS
jgi:hypothetical protein